MALLGQQVMFKLIYDHLEMSFRIYILDAYFQGNVPDLAE